MEKYDLVIIGTGPAGYAASVYASRYKVNHVVIGAMPGGTASSAHRICNFPGYEEIPGLELMMKMRQQMLSYGTKEVMDRVVGISKEGNDFVVNTEKSGSYRSSSVLVAVGTKRRKLGLKEEKKYEGKGLSYCVTCDGMFYKDKEIAVVGGSDAANMATVYLSDIVKKVYVIYRGQKLRGEQLWIDEVMKAKNVEIIFNANVVELLGESSLEGVRLDKDNMKLDVGGVFVEIGSDPSLDFELDIDLNEAGYIVVDKAQKTSLDGIYAAGDITTNSNGFQQVVTACSEGAIAINSIYYCLKKL